MDAGEEASLESVDQRDVHPTDIADDPGLRLESRGRSHQERTLLLREDETGHVRGVNHRVHDREAGVGELGGNVGHRIAEQEPYADHQIRPFRGLQGQQFLTVGPVLVGRRLGVLRPQFRGRLVEARSCRVVERLITPTTDVIDQTDADRLTCRGWRRRRHAKVGRVAAHHDLAGDDPSLPVVELARDVVHVAARGGVADPVHREVEYLGTGRERTGLDRLDGVEHRHVHPLEHRREDVGLEVLTRCEVLVGVHPDRPHVRVVGLRVVLGGLEQTTTRAARRVIDHVGALLEHRLRDHPTRRRIVETTEVRRLRHVLGYNLDRGVDGLHPGQEAGLESVDQRDVHPTYVTDGACLRLESRRHAHQERTLLLREDQPGHVRGFHHRVHDREVRIGILRRHVGHRFAEQEADPDHQVRPLGRLQVQQFLTVGPVLVGRRLRSSDPQLGHSLVEARRRRIVERLITPTTDVIDQTDADGLTRHSLGGCGGVGSRLDCGRFGRLIGTASRREQPESRQHDQQPGLNAHDVGSFTSGPAVQGRVGWTFYAGRFGIANGGARRSDWHAPGTPSVRPSPVRSPSRPGPMGGCQECRPSRR